MKNILAFYLFLAITSSDPATVSGQTSEPACIDCHSTLSNSIVKHEAIENGCDLCHMETGETHPQNNVKGFTLTDEMPALCFMCHDSELMTTEKTTSATNFRNGEENMHFLHINGEKGRNCNLCHNVHGSAFEHLIADKVLFGTWEMPIQYIVEQDGGSCKTGCHRKKKYFR